MGVSAMGVSCLGVNDAVAAGGFMKLGGSRPDMTAVEVATARDHSLNGNHHTWGSG